MAELNGGALIGTNQALIFTLKNYKPNQCQIGPYIGWRKNKFIKLQKKNEK